MFVLQTSYDLPTVTFSALSHVTRHIGSTADGRLEVKKSVSFIIKDCGFEVPRLTTQYVFAFMSQPDSPLTQRNCSFLGLRVQPASARGAN